MKQCEKCGGNLEVFDFFLKRFVRCECPCRVEERNRRRNEMKAQEEYDRIQRMPGIGVTGKYKKATFSNDAGYNPRLSEYCRNYAAGFRSAQRDNTGLLLWGEVGTGKSFFAACIVNELLENSIPAAMMKESEIVNELGGYDNPETNAKLNRIANYSLFVLDDLGAGRTTEYFQSKIFDLIDSRYQANKPTIITTNLTLQEIRNATDLQQRRIYDRILEMCTPVRVMRESCRKQIAEEKKAKAQQLLTNANMQG